jgi:hypothetical protein
MEKEARPKEESILHEIIIKMKKTILVAFTKKK